MPVPSRRCGCCRCPEDLHQHYARPSDTRCATCGPALCPRYIDPDLPAVMWRMTAAQRRTRPLADERQAANTIALLPFTRSRFDPPPLPIPAQRAPSITEVLEVRRAKDRDRHYRKKGRG